MPTFYQNCLKDDLALLWDGHDNVIAFSSLRSLWKAKERQVIRTKQSPSQEKNRDSSCFYLLGCTIKFDTFYLAGQNDGIGTVIRIWYSLRISESDFSLLMSALRDLLDVSDLNALTNGFVNMVSVDQLGKLKEVWQVWVQLSSLTGPWVTEQRNDTFDSDTGSAAGIFNYLNSIPKDHKRSAKLWMKSHVK